VAAKKTPSKEDLRHLGGDAEEGGAAGWEAPRRRGSEAAAAAAAAVDAPGVAAVVQRCRCCRAEVSLLLCCLDEPYSNRQIVTTIHASWFHWD
jgi:hypothetical protein